MTSLLPSTQNWKDLSEAGAEKNPNICRNMLSLFRPAKVDFKPFGRSETTAEKKNRNQLLWTDYNIVNIWQCELRLQFCLEQNILVFFCLCHWWSWGCCFLFCFSSELNSVGDIETWVVIPWNRGSVQSWSCRSHWLAGFPFYCSSEPWRSRCCSHDGNIFTLALY